MSAIELPFAVDPARLLRDLEIQRCERSLVYFVKSAWHVLEPAQPYIHNWHIDMMCERLEAFFYRQITNLLINVPPGTMKSIICSVCFQVAARTAVGSLVVAVHASNY